MVRGRKEECQVAAQGAGAGVSFEGDEDVLKVGNVVVTPHGKCTKRHSTIHFKVVKMVNFSLCEFHLSKIKLKLKEVLRFRHASFPQRLC